MIRFSELARRNERSAEKLVAAAARVIASGRYILGPEVEAFERAWAAYCGTRYCVGVACGMDAITIALMTVAPSVVLRGEVIVPAATCLPTFLAVTRAGGIPVPVDIDADGDMDPGAVCKAITPNTVAILPVHLYGRAANLAAIFAMAEMRGLPVVTDAAQGHGLRVIGTTAFSFYPTKNLGGVGDGGAIVTNDARDAQHMRTLRFMGQGEIIGLNSRLDELQAALLLAKLDGLDEENARRRAQALAYDSRLTGCAVKRPRINDASVWHQYVIRHPRRDELRANLLIDRGIETMPHYATPPHLMKAYAHLGYGVGSFPKAESLFRECLSLPIGGEVSDEELAEVASAVRALA